MGTMLQDLRYAVRSLRKAPLFTAVAVFSLALGIGANTAIFTLIDQLILQLLPVRHPEELVLLTARGARNRSGGRADDGDGGVRHYLGGAGFGISADAPGHRDRSDASAPLGVMSQRSGYAGRENYPAGAADRRAS